MKKLKVVLIGAGGRGLTYVTEMRKFPEMFEVVAAADPDPTRMQYIIDDFNIPENMRFTHWKDLLKLGKIADVAVIATPDRLHYEPAMGAIGLGYDILLEKPIGVDPKETYAISRLAQQKNIKILICTVLRYTPFFMKLKDLIDEGRVGKIMSVNHEECVGHEHQSHSFVRGCYCNEGRSSSMILQKSCHDMDILQWLIGKKCKKIQSYGTLSYFRRENAPEGSPEYCYEGCPDTTCTYNAEKIYYEDVDNCWYYYARLRGTYEQKRAFFHDLIRNTQMGKCVFKCDNDVVDHQTANILFEDDVTVTFTMNAFNKGGRWIHIFGTEGEIKGNMNEGKITLFDLRTRKTEEFITKAPEGDGHRGGDTGIVDAFYKYVTGMYDGKSVPEIHQTAENHLMCFAAEESRKTGKTIDFDEYIKCLE